MGLSRRCPPFRSAPTGPRWAEHGDKLTIAKLNIDENPQIARDYQVMSIPTMTVFQGGKPVKSIIGAKPKGAILSDLADFL